MDQQIRSRSWHVLLLALVAFTWWGPSVHGQELFDHWHETDGPVKAIAVDSVNNVAYLGGSFTYVGQTQRNIAGVNAATGVFHSDWVQPNGTVRACVPDGTGGWFIGGQFTQVNGVPRNRFARLNPDGSLSDWTLAIDGLLVESIALFGDYLLLSGSFTSVGGQPANRVARVHVPTATGLPSSPTANSSVNTFTVLGDTVFAGGSFTQFSGQYRFRLAAFLLSTGELLPWAPTVHTIGEGQGNPSTILTLVATDSVIYAGGNFNHVNYEAHSHLAAIDRMDGSLRPWNAAVSNRVRQMVEKDGILYFGGDFTTVGGIQRKQLAAVDLITATVTDWAPNLNWPISTVHALNIHEGSMYIGGLFTSVNDQARSNVAAVDLMLGETLPWEANTNARVWSIACSGQTVVTGGQFTMIDCVVRNNLCAIDLHTGRPTEWDPGTNGAVNTMLLSDTILFIGGDFGSVSGQDRVRLAAVSTSTGIPTTLSADMNNNGRVLGMALCDSLLFVAGNFNSFKGEPREHLAAINTLTGDISPTIMNVYGFHVNDLVVRNDTIYLAGSFSTVAGIPRQNLASFVVSTGELTPLSQTFNPLTSIYKIELSGPDIFMAGPFASVNGEPREGFASIHLPSDTLSPWVADANNVARVVQVKGDLLFAGGSFTTINGAEQEGLAVFSRQTGEHLPWQPGIREMPPPPSSHLPQRVHAIAFHDSLLLVAGAFTEIGGQARKYFAALHFCHNGPYYIDNDGDGFGVAGTGTLLCPSDTAGYVLNALDCDDSLHGQEIGSPCDDGDPATINDTWTADCTCAGLLPTGVASTTGQPGLRAHPNPVDHTLFFSEPVTGTVHDVQGRLMLSLAREQQIDVSGLAPGMYQLRSVEGAVVRFVKQ